MYEAENYDTQPNSSSLRWEIHYRFRVSEMFHCHVRPISLTDWKVVANPGQSAIKTIVLFHEVFRCQIYWLHLATLISGFEKMVGKASTIVNFHKVFPIEMA